MIRRFGYRIIRIIESKISSVLSSERLANEKDCGPVISGNKYLI